jgi:hypothetical protein
MDVNGDGSPDLDPSRIYFFGVSEGANEGAPFLAVEPDVLAGDLSDPGSSFINKQGRIAPTHRPEIGNALAARVPSLINTPGISVFGGVDVTAPYMFDENMPLRDGTLLTVTLEDGTTRTIQSPVTNTVPGAMAIQEFFDNGQWASHADALEEAGCDNADLLAHLRGPGPHARGFHAVDLLGKL